MMQIDMRVLVTGGAGFVGSAIIRRMVEEDQRVVISLDNYSSGTTANHVEGATYIHASTWEIDAHADAIGKPDLICHFGEFSRVVPSLQEPGVCLRSNQHGTACVIQFAVANNSKLVYSGSSAIFGNDMTDQHLNPYAWSKAKNVELLHNYKHWFDLNFAICYFYNVFGPGQVEEGTYATVIGIFERQKRQGCPLTVVKPGTQTRCFTHIDDIVDGIMRVALGGEGDGYFLGVTESTSILDVANQFRHEYVLVEPRPGERVHSVVKESRARTELNWSPKRSLADYIGNIYIEYV